MFKSIDELPSRDRPLVRVDLNSPVEEGIVQDNRRFDRHARTIQELAAEQRTVLVLAHQGRPGQETFVSMEQHAELLAEHLDRPVTYCEETVGQKATRTVERAQPGEVVLLENVRMNEAELADCTPAEHAESEFVKDLSALGTAYVGDAFSAAHRSHASIVGPPMRLPAYAGRVMVEEYQANSAIRDRTFDGPVRMVLGGTKADDLLTVIEAVSDRVDTFLLGGVIGELCLRAAGYEVGYDVGDMELFDPLWEQNAALITEIVDGYGDQLLLPDDFAYEEGGDRAEIDLDAGPKERPYLDIGSRTIARYQETLADSAAVFVKGAVGVFEDERFRDGTFELVRSIGESEAFSVVGGGDTSRVIDLYGLESANFSHVSIAGGAYVRALAGQPLVGVDVLTRED